MGLQPVGGSYKEQLNEWLSLWLNLYHGDKTQSQFARNRGMGCSRRVLMNRWVIDWLNGSVTDWPIAGRGWEGEERVTATRQPFHTATFLLLAAAAGCRARDKSDTGAYARLTLTLRAGVLLSTRPCRPCNINRVTPVALQKALVSHASVCTESAFRVSKRKDVRKKWKSPNQHTKSRHVYARMTLRITELPFVFGYSLYRTGTVYHTYVPHTCACAKFL